MARYEAVNEATQQQEENGSCENGNEIGDLVNDIKKELQNSQTGRCCMYPPLIGRYCINPPLTGRCCIDHPLIRRCCIYRVPNKIRKHNEAAYSPTVVYIGPFHNGDKRLESMEKLKLRYLQSFISRDRDELLGGFVRFLKQNEVIIRSFYDGTIRQRSDKFVKVILVDSCFIFELFLRHNNLYSYSEEDVVLSEPWLRNDINQDLMLLENQIPFSILQALFDKEFSSQSSRHYPPFVELTLDYFNFIRPQAMDQNNPTQFHHFTDLLRMFYLPPIEQRSGRAQRRVEHLLTASELLESGLKFKAKQQNKLHLQFQNGELELTCLKVEDKTEQHMRNVMAFEQCHYPNESYVTDYMFVLDFLINTSKDVDVLVQHEVITNSSGDPKAVATMVNNLCKNIMLAGMSSHHYKVCDDLMHFVKIIGTNGWQV